MINLQVDELHLVGEPSRGNILEMLFTNVLYLKGILI